MSMISYHNDYSKLECLVRTVCVVWVVEAGLSS
jgi:hypothetical protein